MREKPFKGTIENWRKVRIAPGIHVIEGDFVDHPQFAGKFGHTSYIVRHDEATGELETRNSRYLLGEKAGEMKRAA